MSMYEIKYHLERGETKMTREELLKVSKPILFNTEMVQATLEGRKTCTRRVIKQQAKRIYWNPSSYPNGWTDEHGYQRKEPYQVGDILLS